MKENGREEREHNGGGGEGGNMAVSELEGDDMEFSKFTIFHISKTVIH